MTTVQIKGLAELNRALAELPPRLARNVLRCSVAAGAAVIRQEAKERAPTEAGECAAGYAAPGILKRVIYSGQTWSLARCVG